MNGSGVLTNRLHRGFRRLFRGRDTRVRYLLNYADATFTRSSEAAYWDPRTGAFARIPSGVPDPTASTNGLTDPTDFAAASWTPLNGCSVGDDLETAPDGSSLADRLTDSSAGQASMYQSPLIELGQVYTVSCWFKPVSGASVAALSVNTGGANTAVQLDASTGKTSVVGAVNNPIAFSYKVGDWWRLMFAFKSAQVTANRIVYVIPSSGTTLGTEDATATGTMAAWGATVETGNKLPWSLHDEGRIFSDGSILIEGSRTNAMPDSADMSTPPKDHLNSPTITDNDAAAPDGSGMDLITYAAAGVDGQVRDALDDTLFTDGSDSQFSVFLQGDGADQLRIFFRDKASATALDETITPAAEIERIVRTVANGTGTTDPLAALIESTDAGAFHAWGWQVEPDATFASSPIRTSGAAATRAVETCVIPAATDFGAMLNVGVKFDFTPGFASADLSADFTQVHLFHLSTAASNQWKMTLAFVAGGCRLRIWNNVGGVDFDRSVTFSAGQKLTIAFEPAVGSLTLSGFTTGNGAFSGTARTWTEDANYHIGSQKDGADPAYGVISRMRGI